MPSRINVPPTTRGLLIALLCLSALNASIRYRSWALDADASPAGSPASHVVIGPKYGVAYLVLIPLKSIRYPWTALTSALVEQNVVSLAASALTIFYGGRYLERAWGSTEFAKFCLFVTMLPNIMSFFVYFIWFVGSSHGQRYATPINGLVSLEAAFLVSLKQLVPEHTVSLFKGVIKIRIKHFPAIFVLANMVSGPLLGTDTALWLSLFGFFTSWIYLRFYRQSEITSAATGEGSKIKGDASDTFAFAAFFPDPIRVVLDPMCDAIYDMLVQMRVCTPFSSEAVEVGNENAAARSEGGLPNIMNPRGGGGRREEAERRRALALKALDQRLQSAAQGRTASATANVVAPAMPVDSPEATVSAPSESPPKEAQA